MTQRQNAREQGRQGDVLLVPMGRGAWRVVRQVEWSLDDVRTVAD